MGFIYGVYREILTHMTIWHHQGKW